MIPHPINPLDGDFQPVFKKIEILEISVFSAISYLFRPIWAKIEKQK